MSDTEHCLGQHSLKPFTWIADPDKIISTVKGRQPVLESSY